MSFILFPKKKKSYILKIVVESHTILHSWLMRRRFVPT